MLYTGFGSFEHFPPLDLVGIYDWDPEQQIPGNEKLSFILSFPTVEITLVVQCSLMPAPDLDGIKNIISKRRE